MKARIRHPYPLSPKNVSSFSVLGVLLGRFSSVLQHIWISEITARAGALQLWREPSKEVTWLAAKSRKNNLSNSTQEAKAGGSKKCHGLHKPKAETQDESLRMGWEEWPPDEGKGKGELLVWSWKALGEGHVGCEEVRVGAVTLPSASCSVETRKSGCWWGMEMPIPENCCCHTHPAPSVRGMPQNTNSAFFFSVDISGTEGAN